MRRRSQHARRKHVSIDNNICMFVLSPPPDGSGDKSLTFDTVNT